LAFFLLLGMNMEGQTNIYKSYADTVDVIPAQYDHIELGNAGRAIVGNVQKSNIPGFALTGYQGYFQKQMNDLSIDFTRLYIETSNIQNGDGFKRVSFSCISPASNGDYLVGGWRLDPENNNNKKDAIMLRLNASGGVVWYREVPEYMEVYDVIETEQGDIIWLGFGEFQGINPGADVGKPVLFKTSGSGAMIWNRTITDGQDAPITGVLEDIVALGQGQYGVLGTRFYLGGGSLQASRPIYIHLNDSQATPSLAIHQLAFPGSNSDPISDNWQAGGIALAPGGNVILVIDKFVNLTDSQTLLSMNPVTLATSWIFDYDVDSSPSDISIDPSTGIIGVTGLFPSSLSFYSSTGTLLKIQELPTTPNSYGFRSIEYNTGLGNFLGAGLTFQSGTFNKFSVVEHKMPSTTQCGETLPQVNTTQSALSSTTLQSITYPGVPATIALSTFDYNLEEATICGSNCQDPIAVNDTIYACNTADGLSLSLDIIANDTQTNLDPDDLNITNGPFPAGSATFSLSGTNLTVNVTPGFVGTITLDYEFTDDCGTATGQVILFIKDIPIANFSFIGGGVNYTFTDLSTNDPDAWSWDFGDGNTSTAQNPTHSYAMPGIYTVCLTAANVCGSNQYCEELDTDECPLSFTTGDYFAMCQPGPATFPILDNDVLVGPTTIAIDIPPSNGTAFLNGSNELVYNPDPTFFGNDTVWYTVCNPCGVCAFTQVIIEVEPFPTANFSATPASGLTVDFTDLSIDNLLIWDWTFGDGNFSPVQNPTHTYAAPGTYNVCLIVANDCGPDQYCQDVTVGDCPGVDPVDDEFDMCQPGPATFPILDNDFFGGGTLLLTFSTGPANGVAAFNGLNELVYAPNPGFVGTETIVYQLCNDCGNCGTATVTIIVEDAPAANFSGAITGNTVNFTDLSSGSPTSWFWDFGDGNNSTVQNPMHTYAGPGNYTVCLTVANDCGQDQICEDYPIQDCEPIDPVADQFSMCQPGPANFPILFNDFIGGSYTVSIVSPPSSGTASINAFDELVYTPN
ncbi:MAG: PKD domain-containing protein, partial [Bacteroidota bacterium]